MYIKLRKGIAMIELIFALVIIGISLMSAPMLISQATKGSIFAFQQESIAIIAAHTNAIMTYSWDEQNTESQNDFRFRILGTDSTEIELNAASRVTPGKRQFDANPLAIASPLRRDSNGSGGDNTDDDIDDFIDNTQTLTFASAATIDEGDYMDQNILLTNQVDYINDAAAYATVNGVVVFNLPKGILANTTNIKYITSTLTSTSLSTDLANKTIVMRAFMCNIGAAAPDSSEDLGGTLNNTTPAGYF